MATKALNKNLHKAKRAKNDEFYTLLNDVANELKHYRKELRGKVVLCNCDDPFESNFFKYFAANFNALGLKKLIVTSYQGSSITGEQLSLFDIEGLKPECKEPYAVEINEVPDLDNDGAISLDDVEYLLKHDKNVVTPLKDGDFRSDECVELLKRADVVVTNPPFSLFREYVSQLIEFNKKFLIIGNTNAITYKDIFKLLKEDKIRTGYTNFNVSMFFIVPDDWETFHHIDENGKKIAKVAALCWFTNLDVDRQKEKLILYKKYTPEEYPKYDNYNAIEVSKVSDIPVDYDGMMGVPITFIGKHNPEQFEIVKFRKGDDNRDLVINGKSPYFRILIKRKQL